MINSFWTHDRPIRINDSWSCNHGLYVLILKERRYTISFDPQELVLILIYMVYWLEYFILILASDPILIQHPILFSAFSNLGCTLKFQSLHQLLFYLFTLIRCQLLSVLDQFFTIFLPSLFLLVILHKRSLRGSIED